MTQIYVLWDNEAGPMVAHTTMQGATEEMADYPPDRYTVAVMPIDLVDDHDN